MSIKSNIDYWNELNQGGKVFSCLRDGFPRSFWRIIIAFNHPLIICGMAGIGMLSIGKAAVPKHFMAFQTFPISFGAVCDLIAALPIHSMPGLARALQWSYITYNPAGNYYHSNIFSDDDPIDGRGCFRIHCNKLRSWAFAMA
jgi:hypothetical protein